MKYTLDKIQNQFQEDKKLKYLFFWGHTPKVKGIIDKSCFSQWYPAKFEIKGVIYKTAEHYMMAKKAELFNDLKITKEVINSEHPNEAKKLGRKVKNFDTAIWDKHKYEIVKEANKYKFSQNTALKIFLKQTKDRILVEASPMDAIWGIGIAQDHKDAINPLQWRGENLLGFALMEVRDEIT
ncbi:NADAR family protein [Aquimarina rhabdastrellae]